MAGKRTLGDWIWTLVGIGGLACIGIAIWMFFGGRAGPTPEQAAKARAEQAKEHLEKGRALLADGEGEEAAKEIQAAISLGEDPRQPLDVVYDLGRALALAGKKEDAARVFALVLNRQPTWFAPYLALAHLLDSQDQPAGAWRFYRAALALHPEPVPDELKTRVAELGTKIESDRVAEIARVRAEFRANPANVEALTVLVMAALEDAKPAVEADATAGLGEAVAAAGAGLEGLADLLASQESAVKDRPGSVVDRAGLGYLALLSGDAARAREVFAKAIELSDSDPSAHLGAALAALLSGADDETAEEDAAKRKHLQGNPVAWLALGAARLAHGKTEAARAALSNALRLNPVVPEVYRLFAKGLDPEKGGADREAALRAYERLTE